MLLLLAYNTATAQCPLGCNNSVQISLDDDCSVEVTPDMVLEGQGTNGCDYTVQVLGSNNQPIPNSPFVGAAYIGQTLTVKVSLGANSCWGTITIEDKLAPIIDCPDDMTVSCYESSNFPPPVATDNCDGTIPVEVISDEIVDLDCDNEFSARRTIIYQATDDSGNESAFCVKTIFFERIGLDSIVFPLNRDGIELAVLECDNMPFWDADDDYYPDPEETGTPTTTDGFNIFPNNSYCELNATYSDQVLPICESSFKVLRNWTILDWCTGEIISDFQIIKVVDNEAPIVTCAPDNTEAFGISADPYDCEADWLVPDPIVIYDCSSTTYTVQYLLADDNGAPPVNGVYIDDNVVQNSDGSYTIKDLPLGRTWVRYTITDACGNSAYCFTEVDVIDDVPPVAVCDEFTVATLTNSGYAHIFAQSFDDGSHDNCSDVKFDVRRMTPGCGVNTNQWGPYAEFCCADLGKEIMVALRVTDESENSNTCMVIVTVQDKLDPTITCPPDITVDCGTDTDDLTITGEATGTDNCGDPTITFTTSGSLNDCGTGTLFRTFTATDAGGRTKSCTQRITVIDDTPFNGSSIQWPADRNLTGCGNADTDPSSTGSPTYPNDLCSLVADTYEDQVFTFVDNACLKILRTWTVIDWCTFDQNNPSYGGIYQYTQVIKVNNNVAPEFTNCSNITVDAFGEDCNGFADIVVLATDDCTPSEDIEYTYSLDEYNDGTIEDFGNTNDASQTLPVGIHKITFTAEDQCGNQTTCMFTINVRDRKKPTPYCLSEITTVIMPSTGEIDIWATDFDLGSTDNCPGDLLISFSSNTNNTIQVFTCDDLGINTLEIWVTDAAGNQDFCTTTINIQSNGGCSGSRIGGDVFTGNNDMIEEVMVSLTNMNTQESQQYMTPNSGHYQFLDIPENANYNVKPTKNSDHKNGVSTLDLVLIQRHILGLEEFDSPYKVIAADINNSESLSSTDLLGLRKLILGIYSEFPNNTSWRFVDANQQFADNNDPFPFTESISIYNFNSIDMDNNFVGVKVGDVNNSASFSNAKEEDESTTRSGQSLDMILSNVEYTSGELVSVPVTASNFDEIIGFQFTLETEGLEFVNAIPGALQVNESNIASFTKEDMLTVSWNAANGLSLDENEILFTLVLRAKTNNDLHNVNLSSSITKAEAYTSDLELADLSIEVRDNDTNLDNATFELYQNTPNPFESMTTITFSLPTDGKVNLKVFDITGKVIYTESNNFFRGVNEITLDGNKLNTKGILFYHIEYNGVVATRKMISM